MNELEWWQKEKERAIKHGTKEEEEIANLNIRLLFKEEKCDMDAELIGKILRIGMIVLDELFLNKDNVLVHITKNISGNTIITDTQWICHISDSELKYLEEHKNE